MNNLVEKLIDNISRNAFISIDKFEQEINKFDFELPHSYLKFMKITNGGSISWSEYVYFDLWPIEEILSLNKGYEVDEFANGYLIFGSNGGGIAYAINKKTKEFVEFEFIGDDEPILLGKDFNEFIKNLVNKS